MTEFISLLLAQPYWVFIALGGILLILEVLGAGGTGYLLWSGISAGLVGALAWLFPVSWPVLWILFAIFTLITGYLWWLWMRKYGNKGHKKSYLNQPQHDLIGIKTAVVEAIINGHGRVKIKDGTWSATCKQDLSMGTRVIVVSVDGLTLTVEPIV